MYTKGPWIAKKNGITVGPFYYSAYFENIQSGVEMRDNARLIAAAPDLLEALRETNDALLSMFGCVTDPLSERGWSDGDMFDIYRDNAAAIAKATQT